MHKSLAQKSTREHEEVGWHDDAELCVKSFDEALPRIDHLDLRKVMNLNLDPILTPSFKTFNLARTYSLRVNLQIKCAGKERHVFGTYSRCTLLSKDFMPGLLDYTLPPSTPAPTDGEGTEMLDEPPPPYERFAETPTMPSIAVQPSLSYADGARSAPDISTGVTSSSTSCSTIRPLDRPVLETNPFRGGFQEGFYAEPSLTPRPDMRSPAGVDPHRYIQREGPSLALRPVAQPPSGSNPFCRREGPSLTPRPTLHPPQESSQSQQRRHSEHSEGPSFTVRPWLYADEGPNSIQPRRLGEGPSLTPRRPVH